MSKTAPTSNAQTTTGARILVVDDNEIYRKVILDVLKQAAYSPTGANDGMHAVEILRTEKFDLILLDCQMPKLDGFQTARMIRQDASLKCANLPIIALTGNLGERENCLASGMNDCLGKPIGRALLIQAIEHHLHLTAKPTEARQTSNETKPFESSEFYKGVVQIFLETTPQHLNKMRIAIEGGDSTALRREAHSFLSSCAALNFRVAVGLCRELENISEGDQLGAQKLFAALENEVSRCCETLRRRSA